MAPNTNQILFIVIFCLLAFILVLLTYVCWLKRMKMRIKGDILEEQHRLERQQQAQSNVLTTAELQHMKPALLQHLYGKDLQCIPAPAYSNPFDDTTPQYTPHDENVLVAIHDERERDATIIHTEQQYNNTRNNSRR